jgi:hypothetical protein
MTMQYDIVDGIHVERNNELTTLYTCDIDGNLVLRRYAGYSLDEALVSFKYDLDRHNKRLVNSPKIAEPWF